MSQFSEVSEITKYNRKCDRFKDYKEQQRGITNKDRFWIQSTTKLLKIGLQSAMGLQSATSLKVIISGGVIISYHLIIGL